MCWSHQLTFACFPREFTCKIFLAENVFSYLLMSCSSSSPQVIWVLRSLEWNEMKHSKPRTWSHWNRLLVSTCLNSNIPCFVSQLRVIKPHKIPQAWLGTAPLVVCCLFPGHGFPVVMFQWLIRGWLLSHNLWIRLPRKTNKKKHHPLIHIWS